MPTGIYGPCKDVTKNATHLIIQETEIVVDGKSSNVYEIVQKDGSKIIQMTEGECFNLVVENQTNVPTGIHWHGLILPNPEDGVPYVTQAAIPPGKSYPYNFEIVQSGTFWAHTHYGLQEQKLMALPLILYPKEDLPHREIVLFFEGFTFKSIREVWTTLRKDFMAMSKTKGSNWIPPQFLPRSKRMPVSLNDVQFDAYLTNRTTLEKPDVYIATPGETIRLRLINGSASSGFHVMLGQLEGKVIAVDGSPIVLIAFNEFPIATAQRVDVLVTIPKEGGAFPILAQSQGTNMLTGCIVKTKEAKTPTVSSRTKAQIGAITNSFEKELHAMYPLKPRKVDRVLKVELGGNMKYYVWSINNHAWPNDQPLFVKEGERVEIEFVNTTAMSHPMHLHGHVFQVVEIDGDRFSGAMRDTILVMPNQTVKVQFDANNPGIWAMHCHISYHSWSGMFTVVLYDKFTPPYFSKEALTKYSRTYGGY